MLMPELKSKFKMLNSKVCVIWFVNIKSTFLNLSTGAYSAPKSHTKLTLFLIDIVSLDIFEPIN